ncbi:MAG: hypothetical protein JWO67_2400 [Streptosporangiaceae bacterium]|nr:hypothetical protein [Streptosporangiaceae bacterium]
MNRSPMGRPTRPMPKMSAKKLAALGGFASSTFDRPAPQTPAGGGNGPTPARGLKASRSRFLRDPAAVIEERSGRVCEIQLEGCYGRAAEKSHRITQKAGGRHGAAKVRSDRPSNALDACSWCHLVITERPWLVDAKGNGWVLEEWQEPTQEPVLYRGEPMYLDDAGGLWSLEEVGA